MMPSYEHEGDRHLTDRLGALAGALCAIHCAATIPLAGLLSTDLGGLLGHEAEAAFIAIAAVLVLASSIHGYRHHRSLRILAAFAGCFALWLAGTFFATGAVEATAHVAAAIGLAATHLVSLKRLRSCRH